MTMRPRIEKKMYFRGVEFVIREGFLMGRVVGFIPL